MLRSYDAGYPQLRKAGQLHRQQYPCPSRFEPQLPSKTSKCPTSPVSEISPKPLKMAPTDIPAFTTTQLSLLSAELAAEVDESSLLVSSTSPAALQRAGFALTNLTLASQRTGLGGKTVITLEPDSATASGTTKDGAARLPEHGIRVGDIVSVQELGSGAAKKKEKSEIAGRSVSGVVLKIAEGAVGVALDKEDAEVPSAGRLWLCVSMCILISKKIADVRVESSWRMMSLIGGTISLPDDGDCETNGI